MSGGSPGASSFFPTGQDVQEHQPNWGVYPYATLPNQATNILVAGKWENLRVGQIATSSLAAVPGAPKALFFCLSTGTAGGGNAVWIPVNPLIAPEFEWNLNGVLAPFTPESAPGAFNGLNTTADVVALSGPGPFDSTRLVRLDCTLQIVTLILRVPPTVLSDTSVEVYRVRPSTALVASVGVFTVSAGPSAFTTSISAPVLAPLVAGDLLFTALAATAPAGAADLSVSIEVSVP